MVVDYGFAFFAGLFGAAHCVGMCGGIAGGFFSRFERARPLTYVQYHATRLLMYVLLGAAGALLGRVLVQSGIVGKGQGLLMIGTGLLVILFGLRLTGVFQRAGDANPMKFVPFSHTTRGAPTFGGLLNGLVPCSLVFSVAIKAVGMANPLHAALFMLAFGMGTLPANVAVSVVANTAANFPRMTVRHLTGWTVVLLGIWTLYEGTVFFNVMRGLANW